MSGDGNDSGFDEAAEVMNSSENLDTGNKSGLVAKSGVRKGHKTGSETVSTPKETACSSTSDLVVVTREEKNYLNSCKDIVDLNMKIKAVEGRKRKAEQNLEEAEDVERQSVVDEQDNESHDSVNDASSDNESDDIIDLTDTSSAPSSTDLHPMNARLVLQSTRKHHAFCKASTHQGDPTLFQPSSVGRQCLPNSLTAIAVATIHPISTWTTSIMDDILCLGDKLYLNIDVPNEFLLPTDLPTCVKIENTVCHFMCGKEAFGSFTANLHTATVILTVLCICIQKAETSALLNIGELSGASAIAVTSVDTSFFIFDSHSRGDDGLPSPNGTAVLMKFENVYDTVCYICQLAEALTASLFHWVFWNRIRKECDENCEQKGCFAIATLLEGEIMELYSHWRPHIPEIKNRRGYYRIYKRKLRESSTNEEKLRRQKSDKIKKRSSRLKESEVQTRNRNTANRNRMKEHRSIKKLKTETVENAQVAFKLECKKQPVYICTVCHRLLWRKSVQIFSYYNYGRVKDNVKDYVLNEKYMKFSIDRLLYVCHTCNQTLKSNKVPPQSKANQMDLEEIPNELENLNTLELHLIRKRILFMKLVKLPKGNQTGIKGAAVNVPADLGPACNLLPRLPSAAHIISLKLKRKLEYKHAYIHDTIRPEKVIAALHYLKNNNPMYSDIDINSDWIEKWKQLDEDIYGSVFQSKDIEVNSSDSDSHQGETITEETDCDDYEEERIAMEENCKLRDMPYDTCLQNEQFEEPNQIFSIAPGEGSKPIPLLTDNFFEQLANPDKFPSGKGSFSDTLRNTPLTLGKYVNARLLDQDGRFAKDIEYIFGMQYAVEHKQVRDTVSIALRQTRGRQQRGSNIQAGMLKNPYNLQNLFKKDRAYSFLKNIRGTPPYWQKMFYEVLSMIRQLGIPTWFLTLSAADMKWPEVIQSIAAQYGTIYTEAEVEELPWRTKSMWLRSNPVTAARMFQYRLDSFVNVFLKNSSHPIGPIIDYVIRIEFQARGSPHAHTLMWIKEAPKLGYSKEEEVIEFIDKYVSCSIPDGDHELKNCVESLQIHHHSPTCRRKGKCRFNYPKPPSPFTIISDEPLENCNEQMDFASTTLTLVKEVLENTDLSSNITLEEILDKARVAMDDYIKALSVSRSGRSVILKRKPSEQKVNCYCPAILRAWQANMDIQYVVDAYACVMYVASYVMKAEKGMGELLKQTAKEIGTGNIRQQLNKLGAVFLTNREVSAQEAVYRALSMPLRKCSRTVVFLNTDTKESRASLLLPLKQLQGLDDNDENVFCSNIIDRYTARPDDIEHMCLAVFAATYTYTRQIKSKTSEDVTEVQQQSDEELPDDVNIINANTITLKNGRGLMRRRKRRAVIRWHNFNVENEAEKHFRSRLMLFIPWRNEEQLMGSFSTYMDRYNHELENIKLSESQFTHQEDDINHAFERLKTAGPPEAAWDNLAPGAEESQVLAENEGISGERPMAEEDVQIHMNQIVNEFPQTRNDALNSKYTKEAQKDILTSTEYNESMRQLNKEQKEIVMYHRKWCKETVLALKKNQPIKPYCVFLSGPGGVGKSYVIKMIHTDTIKLLRCSNQIKADDIPILLTAATGVAAHNINGITVHSAFMLTDRRKSATYYGLGADTLNTLQTQLEQLMVVVIDEVSMIGADTLYRIHMRLQEIKGLNYANTRFGNVTIIAVGDLYQLPPFKDKKIYNTPGRYNDPNLISLHGSIWQENFKLHELKEIVRQKDRDFANLLNRVREANITKEDEMTLKSRETTLTDHNHFTKALHVYGTNQQADEYNSMMLQKLETPKFIIKSSDITKDRDTLQVEISLEGKQRKDTGGLAGSLTLAEKAIVRLTSNIDVTDGLANGIRGTIQKIITKKNIVNTVLVKFEDKKVGEKAKAESQYRNEYPDAVPIHRHGVPFQHKNITIFRSQFPLTLSWASTIHSVQGLTVDKIVVDLSKIFAAGQAYVALSRVTSLEGLQIMNFKTTAIRKDKGVDVEMARLKTKTIDYHLQLSSTLESTKWIKIIHLNVRGYLNHIIDIKNDPNILAADIICFTETHLRKSHIIHQNSQPSQDHIMYRKDRNQHMDKGGVAVFIHKKLRSTLLDIQIKGLEFIAAKTFLHTGTSFVVLTIYRSLKAISTKQFIVLMKQLLSQPQLLNQKLIVLGDFNEDLIEDRTQIFNFFTDYGFTQVIHQPTTDQGSLLDHIYVNTGTIIETQVFDTYYSDHDLTVLTIHQDSF